MKRTGIGRCLDAFARRRALKAFRRNAGEAATQGQPIAIVQSCDGVYLPFLKVTSPVNQQYATRHSYVYCDFVGNASPVPKTANFNRYYLMRELLSLRRLHWALWMDADAMVIDHSRRLESIIEESKDKMLIICRGRREYSHAINNGVFFLNLRHPLTASMLRYVIGVCEMLPRANRRFKSDQRHMYGWLLEHQSPSGRIPFIKRYVGNEMNRFNYNGNFIQHVLRSAGTREERLGELSRLSSQVHAQLESCSPQMKENRSVQC